MEGQRIKIATDPQAKFWEGDVLLQPSIVLTQSALLSFVDDGEYPGNVVTHNLDLRQLGCSASCDLRHTKVCELCLQLIELLGKISLGLVGFTKLVTPASLSTVQ